MAKNSHPFYSSKIWAEMRCDSLHIRGEQCELCGSKKMLRVCHLTYDNFGGNEEPEDLIILCHKCQERQYKKRHPAD